MKIFLEVLLVACYFTAIGCQSATQQEAAADTTAATVPTQDTAAANAADNTAIVDPDPTDTIPATAYGLDTYGRETENLVRTKLQDQYKADLSGNIIDSFSRKFIFFRYDLNDDHSKEIFVGLRGPYFCGSGGCTVLLLDSAGNAITRFSVTDYPLIIASSKTNGWKDLILHSNGKNHLVKFNGKKYSSNPSVQPVFNMIPGDELPRLLDVEQEPYAWFTF